ncbi:GNAT family N-acetyltransferase [Candidatus Thorarchaeota archaeon]|nr:MAG: GNAT family N-acetyltransferase [Candidatus Thorarchaeota archaeon]
MSKKKVLKIRAPKFEERDEFYRIYKTGLPGVDEISFKRFREWWDKSHEKGEQEKLWRVALVDDSIIAVVINLVNKELNWGFVWELAVHPDFRNHGIGTKLIQESEKLLINHSPEIDDFAIGVKTNNLEALSLYEKLGYGIRFLELHLKGKKWTPDGNSQLKFEAASVDKIQDLVKLTPDAYWGTQDKERWKEIIKPEDKMFFNEKNQFVGYMRITKQKKKIPYSDIEFSIKPGHGGQVLDASMKFIETDFIELWVQDNHQDILDMLYKKGFKRIESEFLLRKSITS